MCISYRYYRHCQTHRHRYIRFAQVRENIFRLRRDVISRNGFIRLMIDSVGGLAEINIKIKHFSFHHDEPKYETK